MKTHRTTWMVAASVVIALFAFNAQAQHRGGMHHKGKHHGGKALMKLMLRAANPTPEQRVQLKALQHEMRTKRRALKGMAADTNMNAMAAAIASGDEDDLEAAFLGKQKRMQRHHALHLAHLKAVLAIMTDEQRERMAQVAKKMQRRRKAMRNKRRAMRQDKREWRRAKRQHKKQRRERRKRHHRSERHDAPDHE